MRERMTTSTSQVEITIPELPTPGTNPGTWACTTVPNTARLDRPYSHYPALHAQLLRFPLRRSVGGVSLSMTSTGFKPHGGLGYAVSSLLHHAHRSSRGQNLLGTRKQDVPALVGRPEHPPPAREGRRIRHGRRERSLRGVPTSPRWKLGLGYPCLVSRPAAPGCDHGSTLVLESMREGSRYQAGMDCEGCLCTPVAMELRAARC